MALFQNDYGEYSGYKLSNEFAEEGSRIVEPDVSDVKEEEHNVFIKLEPKLNANEMLIDGMLCKFVSIQSKNEIQFENCCSTFICHKSIAFCRKIMSILLLAMTMAGNSQMILFQWNQIKTSTIMSQQQHTPKKNGMHATSAISRLHDCII